MKEERTSPQRALLAICTSPSGACGAYPGLSSPFRAPLSGQSCVYNTCRMQVPLCRRSFIHTYPASNARAEARRRGGTGWKLPSSISPASVTGSRLGFRWGPAMESNRPSSHLSIICTWTGDVVESFRETGHMCSFSESRQSARAQSVDQAVPRCCRRTRSTVPERLMRTWPSSPPLTMAEWGGLTSSVTYRTRCIVTPPDVQATAPRQPEAYPPRRLLMPRRTE